MPSGKLLRAHVALMLATVLWASEFAFNAIALREVGSSVIPLVRYLFAAAPFVAVLAWKGVPRLDREEWHRLAFVGVLATSGFQLTLVHGQAGVGAGTAVVIIATAPMWAAVLARAELGEPMPRMKLVAFAIAFAGVVLIVLGRGEPITVPYLEGLFLIVLAPILWAVASVHSKPLLERCDPFSFVALSILMAIVPLLFIAAPAAVREMPDASPETWVSLAFIGIACTAVATSGFFYGLRALPASTTVAYAYLQPVFGLAWAALLIGEEITPALAAGATLVVVAVAVTNRVANREAHATRRDEESPHDGREA